MTPQFFEGPAEFRRWLETHHLTRGELLVGFHKLTTGKPSMTWPQSVDEALCFGWIDGVRRSLGEEAYTIRFTPRRAKSKWSQVNLARFAELDAQGLVAPAGRAAFDQRIEAEPAHYSYENRGVALSAELERRFREHAAAWAWFETSAPSYRRAVIWWVISAKQEATRERRLAKLIEASAKSGPIDAMKRDGDKRRR